jgi:hypothetical protein
MLKSRFEITKGRMEGTVTGCGRGIKWTVSNHKQTACGASECFQQNAMADCSQKYRLTWKMIGKGRGSKDNVVIGGHRLWQVYQHTSRIMGADRNEAND